jgi:hypothetical protein
MEGSSFGSSDFNYKGNNMDDNVCFQQPPAKSIRPGSKNQIPGTYCLMRYDDECNCVISGEKHEFRENVDPGCIKLDDNPYTYYQWIRTCDEFVSLSQAIIKVRS